MKNKNSIKRIENTKEKKKRSKENIMMSSKVLIMTLSTRNNK